MESKKQWLFLLVSSSLLLGACSAPTDVSEATETSSRIETIVESTQVEPKSELKEKDSSEEVNSSTTSDSSEKESTDKVIQTEEIQTADSVDGYKTITVDGGDMSGYRQPNVRVDIGFEDREYWGFTNEYGQLVRVIADEIILQNDTTESVTSDGRYYSDEAKVPGVESSTLDEGHVIADSLGGVSNAYNITPQDSVMNRHGDQAYMERTIRDAGGATDFEAIITYPDTKTHIPSKYKYTYTVRGNRVVDEFENVNPDEYNEEQGLTSSESTSSSDSKETVPSSEPTSGGTSNGDLSTIDTNNNGIVTITEAKAAGFSMPIMKGHWLYEYMRDNDGDGMVGE